MKARRRLIPQFMGTLGIAGLLALTACSNDSPQSLIASGKQFIEKKDYKAAAIQFKSALQLDPRSADARLLLGEALLSAGDPVGASVELSKALDQQVASEKVLPLLSRAMVLSGDYKNLTTLYGELVLPDKAATAALKANVATAWGALGDRDKTTAAITAALQAVPDFGAAQILNARVLAGKRSFDEAQALVDKIIARDDSQYEAWLLRGEILLVGKNDPKGAEAAFRKALALERTYVPAHLALISLRLRERNMAGVKAQASELKAVLPQHPQTLFVDAQIAFAERNLTQAREICQQLLRMAPNHVGVLQIAGSVEGALGSLVLAETYFNKALQINPVLPVARRNLAQVYLRLGQPDKALAAVQPMLADADVSAEALSVAGEAVLRMGDARTAEALFVRASQVNPDDTRVRTAVALSRMVSGDPNTALAELETLAASSQETFADQALISARMKRKEYSAALAAVDGMIKKQPDNAAPHEMRGRVLLALRDYTAARSSFEQALKLDPAYFAATANLAAIDVYDKKPEQAKRRFEDVIKTDPRNHYASMALAELRLRYNAPMEEVQKILTDAIRATPSEAGPRLQLIDLMLRKRQYKDALALAQDAVAAMPNDQRVIDAAGRAQLEAGDVEQATNTFRRLAGMTPNSGLAYSRLADVYRTAGKRDAAITALKKSLEIEPQLASSQLGLIELLVAANRSKEALELARTIQQQRPRNLAGYSFESMIHMRVKATDAALVAARKGLTATNDPSAAQFLYSSLMQAGQRAEAERLEVSWMKAHPEDARFEYHVAITAMAREDLDTAEARLTRVVGKWPNAPLALNNLAWVLVKKGKPGAVAIAERALAQLPDNAAVIDTLAMALAADKQFDKALVQQKRAVELEPNQPKLKLQLARIAMQAGDKALARKELEQLKALGSTFAEQGQVEQLMKAL
jgi:cellulose synthase operon protein C